MVYVVVNIQPSLYMLVARSFDSPRVVIRRNTVAAETLDDYSRVSSDMASVVDVFEDTQANGSVGTAQRWSKGGQW
ncbi:hypothetical protein TorRG33x02_269040 [Trema orientale]|uniref:Uncharacterized protein n=1 Tax=Trema orientale TaxID=63057 RepID=A0A2P5CYH5_TREOI|nr:hypothetical protein TorRG33x02_269040 [Trema orientale]